jgi:adenine deaminase
MAMAANDVLKMGGGISLVHRGERRARIPLPIGGIASNREVPELADEIIETNQTLWDLGSPLDNPLWTLVFLSFTSVLKLRITYSGVYDVKEGKVIF